MSSEKSSTKINILSRASFVILGKCTKFSTCNPHNNTTFQIRLPNLNKTSETLMPQHSAPTLNRYSPKYAKVPSISKIKNKKKCSEHEERKDLRQCYASRVSKHNCNIHLEFTSINQKSLTCSVMPEVDFNARPFDQNQNNSNGHKPESPPLGKKHQDFDQHQINSNNQILLILRVES